MAYRTITEAEAYAILADEEAEMAPYRAVSKEGLREIESFLAEHHKLGADYIAPDMVRSFAADAEFQLAEGNDAAIEIASMHSVSRRTETYTLSASGVEWQICE